MLPRTLLLLGLTLLTAGPARADPPLPQRVQAVLDTWLADRAPVEKITGVAAYVSFGAPGPAVEAFAGHTGNAADDPKVGRETLFQMGSTSKSFVAAVILKLEAAGKLSIDDTLGKWLPEYPAWQDITIRRLLDMTSGTPNYTETEGMSRALVADPRRTFTPEELIAFAYPSDTNRLPPNSGYYYSNTNYILAGMIAAKAAGRSFRDLVHEMLIEPYGLDSTFYEESFYARAVQRRLAHGYFENPACADYQPGCAQPWAAPLMGRDVRDWTVSWAQAAGGAVANARDVDQWMRLVFSGAVVPPKQQAEWMSLVSIPAGKPIADVTPEDKRGFALGLAKSDMGKLGTHWFYEGESLGYRTLYVWFAEQDLMITVQTNSQPEGKEDKIGDLVTRIHAVVAPETKP